MRKTLLLLLVGLVGSMAASGQPLTVGVKGGVPLTDTFTSSGTGGFNFATKRYTFGPTVEVRLPASLAIEVDALYKRLSFDSSAVPTLLAATTTANAWEFPLLLKIRPRVAPGIRPFIAPGVSFRHVSSIKQVQRFFTGSTVTTSRPDALENRFTAGFAIGAGIEFHPVVLHISPEFRYTRWGWESFRDPGNLFRSQDNQAEFLLGLTF